jgi:hypothetical protein
MPLYDLRHAVRRLLREPGFTLAAVLTLALGVGANVTVFAVVEAVLLRPLPYADADRLVTLNHRDERTGITKPFNALGDYVDFAARQRSFDAFGAYGSGEATIFGAGDPYRVSALVVTSGARHRHRGHHIGLGTGRKSESRWRDAYDQSLLVVDRDAATHHGGIAAEPTPP